MTRRLHSRTGKKRKEGEGLKKRPHDKLLTLLERYKKDKKVGAIATTNTLKRDEGSTITHRLTASPKNHTTTTRKEIIPMTHPPAHHSHSLLPKNIHLQGRLLHPPKTLITPFFSEMGREGKERE